MGYLLPPLASYTKLQATQAKGRKGSIFCSCEIKLFDRSCPIRPRITTKKHCPASCPFLCLYVSHAMQGWTRRKRNGGTLQDVVTLVKDTESVKASLRHAGLTSLTLCCLQKVPPALTQGRLQQCQGLRQARGRQDGVLHQRPSASVQRRLVLPPEAASQPGSTGRGQKPATAATVANVSLENDTIQLQTAR